MREPEVLERRTSLHRLECETDPWIMDTFLGSICTLVSAGRSNVDTADDACARAVSLASQDEAQKINTSQSHWLRNTATGSGLEAEIDGTKADHDAADSP